VSGAWCSQELVKLKIEDIEEIKLGLLVKIPHTKTKKPRSFTVMGENCLRTYRKYLALRPKNFNERRLFIKYQDGVCHRQVVGIHKISSVPQEVAKYLNLENVNEYSGHCLRRTSATLLVDSGGDITSLGVYSSISISSCRIRHISNGCCRTLQMFSILEFHANSSLFNEFVCKLDFFWHDWASLKRE
jgi:integrase